MIKAPPFAAQSIEVHHFLRNLNTSKTKTFKDEAVLLVQNFFEVKGAVDISKTRSARCSIKEMYCEYDGYEPPATPRPYQPNTGVDLEHMQSVLNAMPNVESMKPHGTPQKALLRHYRYSEPLITLVYETLKLRAAGAHLVALSE